MLNKEICQKCSRQYALSVPNSVNIDKWFSWSDESHFVWCQHNYKRDQHYHADIRKGPPNDCPYLLEHTLIEHEKDNILNELVKA
jgi:hypothetical protein